MSLVKSDIEQFITRYKKTYIDNPSVMISGYTQEKQIVADYNGRQILELMQNSDDAGSNIIHIEIDTTKQILCISNNGESFDSGGIESLMFPGISTKNKTEYIGNKGLGFRSILNWVESVKILTKEGSVSFSRKHTELFFNKYLANEPSIVERVALEKKKNKIAEDTIPIATLAFPKIEDEVVNEQYVTQIKLLYKKEEEEAIQEQLDLISEETLLFLPHSTRVVLVKNGLQVLDLYKTVKEDGKIAVGHKTWNVFIKQMLPFNDKVKFNYTIAWQDDLSDKGMFYNYFPTDVATDLPCLIHGTFDLTNNRKELNKCIENEFILNHIADSLSYIANNQLKTTISDWRAFKFLTPTNLNNREFFKPFYNKIRDHRETTQSYPTLDNKYINKDVAKFYGNKLSEWIYNNQLGLSFTHLLKHTQFDLEFNPTDFIKYESKEWVEIAKEISSGITNNSERAKLIKLLIIDCQLQQDENQKMPLLIGSDYKNEKGTFHENVFAYNLEDESFSLPYFANITFIDSDLYKKLTEVFNDEIEQNRDGTEDKSRTLIRILKPVINLRQNDSTEVIRYLISELNKQGPTVDKVKNLTTFLFGLFKEKSDKDKAKKLSIEVPLLNRLNQILDSNKLIFGDDYAPLDYTEFIFDGVYDSNKYLGAKEIYELSDVDSSDLINFFSWLGVQNHFTSIKTKISAPKTDDYFRFIFNEKKEDKPDNARHHNIELDALIIENIQDLNSLELDKLCLLIEKSSLLKRAINFTEDENLNYLVYKYGNAYPKVIKTNYSFIYFQIAKLRDFKQFTLSDEKEFELIFTKLDISNDIFTTYLSKNEVESLKLTLRLLGVSESLEDITEERLKTVFDNQESKFPYGKNSQNFYKKCLEFYLDKRKKFYENSTIDYCNHFFGSKGVGFDKLELIQKDNLYYSDNYLLPRKILNQFYFINLPKRIGEDNVKDIFGVKLIKDELNAIEIKQKETHHLCNEIKKYINSIKAYILAYRIETIKDKTSKQNEANILKRLNIELVSELMINFNNEPIKLEENEFIPFKDTMFIKASYKNNVEELLKVPELCDAIAEVFCITFKVSSLKNTFRRVIKDGPKETLHVLKTDENELLLKEAQELLGVNPLELEFWKKIYPAINFENNLLVDFTSQLEKLLKVNLPDQYRLVDFGNLATKQGIHFLQWILPISGKQLNQFIDPFSLEIWHKENVEDAIRDYLKQFRELLWQKSNIGHLELKLKFHQNYLDFINASNSTFFQAFYKTNQYELQPNYEKALIEFTNINFEINLKETCKEIINIENKYSEIMRTYDIGIDIEDIEKMIKDANPDKYSLIYFEGFENEIIEILNTLKNEINISDEIFDEIKTLNDSKLIISQSTIQAVTPKSFNHSSSKNDYAHTSQITRKKALAGKREENKVVNALRNNGYLVNHVSKLTDSKHYDLEYKKPDGEWRYLEVKKDSGGYFFMSKAEKNTAINDINSNKYDLAIVNGNDINIIQSPFCFENESFENNSKFFAEPTEYIIHFKINKR